MLVWKDFPDADRPVLDWLTTQRRVFPMASFPGTEVLLPSADKADYFAAMKASRRHILKKKLKKSAEAVAVTTEVIQAPDAETLDEIFALFWQTYEKATTKFERLNRRFFDRLAKNGVSHFVVLRERDSAG